MPSKKSAQGKGSNRIRFIMLDADISEGNLSELTNAITNALRPSGLRQVTAPVPMKTIAAINDTTNGTEESAEEQNGVEVNESADNGDTAKAQKPIRPKKPKPPTYLHDLVTDIESFKAFANDKAPESKSQQYLTAMYWLKEQGNSPTANADNIYTCYKTAEWPAGFNDWAQPFHNLVRNEQIRKVGKAEFAINPTGEGTVKALNKDKA